MYDRKNLLQRLNFRTVCYQIKPEFWLLLSLIAPLYFGLISLHHALSQAYIVQDDARIHIIWLQQFLNPQLFPNDLFAQYYQSIQSEGFKLFYWLMAKLGIAPMLLAKLLPPLLGLLTTFYCFKLVLQLLPVPSAAFLSTLILNQNIWLKDDLISATPRAFAYLFLTAFLYYLLNRSLIPCLMAMFLQGLFYPQLLLVEVGVLLLRLLRWPGRSLQLSPHRSDYHFAFCGTVLAAMVVLLFATRTTQFGPLTTVAQMKAMPEFGLNGRREYFGVDPISFWFRGASGFRFPLFPPIIWFSIGLPLVCTINAAIAKLITPEIKVLTQTLLASLGLFMLAHLTFPALYLPSRYTFYSLRVIMSIAAGIVLVALCNWGYRRLQNQQPTNPRLTVCQRALTGFCGVFAIAALVIPSVPPLFLDCQNWVVGTAPGLYQFLAQQPQDSLIASLTKEANNLPAFSQRSVLVSRELALPYHPAFYQQVQQRLVDLLELQYSPELSRTQMLLQKYGINWLLIESRSFEPDYLLEQEWLVYSSVNNVVSRIVAQLHQGIFPALVDYVDRCSVFSEGNLPEGNLTVLDAACINRIETDK
jgi:hypothetical protein